PLDQLRGAALETLRVSSRIESDINAMENAHSEFLLSAGSPFREQFETARTSLLSRIDDLRSLVPKNSPDAAGLANLAEKLKLWDTQYAQPQLQARLKGGDASALTPYSQGTTWLDSARLELRHFRHLGV